MNEIMTSSGTVYVFEENKSEENSYGYGYTCKAGFSSNKEEILAVRVNKARCPTIVLITKEELNLISPKFASLNVSGILCKLCNMGFRPSYNSETGKVSFFENSRNCYQLVTDLWERMFGISKKDLDPIPFPLYFLSPEHLTKDLPLDCPVDLPPVCPIDLLPVYPRDALLLAESESESENEFFVLSAEFPTETLKPLVLVKDKQSNPPVAEKIQDALTDDSVSKKFAATILESPVRDKQSSPSVTEKIQPSTVQTATRNGPPPPPAAAKKLTNEPDLPKFSIKDFLKLTDDEIRIQMEQIRTYIESLEDALKPYRSIMESILIDTDVINNFKEIDKNFNDELKELNADFIVIKENLKTLEDSPQEEIAYLYKTIKGVSKPYPYFSNIMFEKLKNEGNLLDENLKKEVAISNLKEIIKKFVIDVKLKNTMILENQLLIKENQNKLDELKKNHNLEKGFELVVKSKETLLKTWKIALSDRQKKLDGKLKAPVVSQAKVLEEPKKEMLPHEEALQSLSSVDWIAIKGAHKEPEIFFSRMSSRSTLLKEQSKT